MLSARGRTPWSVPTACLGLFAIAHTASAQVDAFCGPHPQEELLRHLLSPLTASCTDGTYAGNVGACNSDP